MPAQIDQQQLARELVEKARAYAELFDARPLRLAITLKATPATGHHHGQWLIAHFT